MSRRSTITLLTGVILFVSVLLSGTAHAAPTVSTIINFGFGTFVENSTVLPDGSLAVSASDGLHHVFLDGSEGPMFLQAESLGGVILKDGMLLVAVGNNGGTGLDGMIWQIDPANPANKQVLVSGISSPNGLIELSDGRVAYSTNLGPHAGIHAFDPANPEQRTVITHAGPEWIPNGLSVDSYGSLYACSTLRIQGIEVDFEVVRVDLTNGSVYDTGKSVPGCDDLTVIAPDEIYVASVAGIWSGANLGGLPSLTLLSSTSIKPAGDGGWIVTTMVGEVIYVHF